ncbi:MAG: hypothetical protein RLZ47_1272 [Bacteroidota bacterium]|jgi:hypothetical protein
MKFFRYILLALLCLPLFVLAQEKYDPVLKGKNDTIRVALTMVDGELIPWATLPEVPIIDNRIFRTPEQQAAYNRLRYNVLKVLPYAMYARSRYAKLQQELGTAKNRKDERMLSKAFEKEIKDMFNREIKNLTITQGGILIKLIDRETGHSSFEILKDMKGGLTAFLYQSVARVFGNNLKKKYDLQEDRDIESIIQQTPYYRYGHM